MDPISPSEIVQYKAEHNRLLKNFQYCLDTRNSQCGDKTVRITRGRVKRVCVERNKSHLEQALCIKIVLPFLQLKWNFNWKIEAICSGSSVRPVGDTYDCRLLKWNEWKNQSISIVYIRLKRPAQWDDGYNQSVIRKKDHIQLVIERGYITTWNHGRSSSWWGRREGTDFLKRLKERSRLILRECKERDSHHRDKKRVVFSRAGMKVKCCVRLCLT